MALSTQVKKSLLIAVASAAAIVGIGMLNYFLAPGEEPVDPASYAELDPATAAGSPFTLETVLYLPWGDGPAEASRVGEPSTSTIESVFSSEGYVFVVDHPQDVFGSRVRWFNRDGSLAGEHTAQGGSTGFAPFPGGFSYVLAKMGLPSERLVLHNVEASGETTYTIPLGVNSGGIVSFGGTLYARVTPIDVDLEERATYAREALVPVARDGVALDDATADAEAVELWGYGMDGLPYTLTTRVEGFDSTLDAAVVLIGSGESRLRVPRQYRLLGVSPSSEIYLSTVPVQRPGTRPIQAAAGWLSSDEPYAEILVIRLDGSMVGTIALPSTGVTAWQGRIPLSLCGDGLYSTREVKGGIAVVVHRFN